MTVRRLFLCVSVLSAASCALSISEKDSADAMDGGTVGADGGLSSRCFETDSQLHCAHHTRIYAPGGLGLGTRNVHWQVPVGAPPASGWPVALLFQGSFFSADTFWDVTTDMPFGGWSQGHVTRTLLDTGIAVITPSTRLGGDTFWDTNVAGFSSNWTASDDHHLLLLIFDDLATGQFGPLDASHMYATGISSGGYMTSRMAVSYGGQFRALAIESASYATCAGALCSLPPTLPADHPPTLFLHGEKDGTVPISTMRSYRALLDMQGTQTREVVDADAGHQWLDVAPGEVSAWFVSH